MSEYIMGIHGFSASSKRLLHDTGACLVKEGKVHAAINEERLSRLKNDGRYPKLACQALLDMCELRPENISVLACPDKRSLWQMYHILKYALKTYQETGIWMSKYLRASLKRTWQFTRRPPGYLYGKPIYYIEHHLCHAASAYYTSPWDDVAIVTLDGMGDWCIGGTINIGKHGKIQTLLKTNGFYSPGFFYMFITSLLGYTAGRHEGKIMGLAAYGDPNKCYEKVKNIIFYRKDKHDFYSDYIPDILQNSRYIEGDIQSDFTILKTLLHGEKPEDIAAAAQKRLEEVVLEFVQDALELTGKKYLVLAGGVFANVKLNGAIRKLENLENVYIYPNMGDGGVATGAALYVYYNKLGNKKTYQAQCLPTMYLGLKYTDTEIESILKKNSCNYQHIENIEKKIAGALHNKKVVGLFSDRMEYGPRALGNRSILAAPVDKEINDWLNKRLRRTEFMPFAPSILEEHAQDYYFDWRDDHIAARFMTITYDVNPKLIDKTPAVTHIDGTARPHVVRKQDNLFYHQIISEYHKLSGIPLVINTSFNIHEEPIVCSPQDALRAFKQGSVDILVLNNFWLEFDNNKHYMEAL